MEINPIKLRIADLRERTDTLRNYMNYAEQVEQLQEVSLLLGNAEVWNDPQRAQKLGRERAALELVVNTIANLDNGLNDCDELLSIIAAENDELSLPDLDQELDNLTEQLVKLEFHRMFSGEMDSNNAYLDIQSGSGGTEAQDWAEMLLRMYLRWCDNEGFTAKIIDQVAGDIAGIKGATIQVVGDYAFGWLRTETGVHRLVRKSPFDSNNRRHTSFASVFVSPEVDDSIDINIDPSEVRVDTYRASGAGGQHVNKTDSAVRLTHLPTGVVAQSQSGRSQHQNKEEAWKMLKAKLYEIEMQNRNLQQKQLEDSKADIGWGSQIRSYILDDARIKDLRTGHENRNTQAVLNGDLKPFIEASLKAGL